MNQNNPYAAPEGQGPTKAEAVGIENVQGLGGWLILVAIGIVLSPLRIAAFVIPTYLAMFANGTWNALTTPGSEHYKSLWAPILLGEMVTNFALIVGWLAIAFLFFTKRRWFPKAYIGLTLFTLIFIIVDALAIKAVLPNEQIFDPDTTKEFTRSLIAAMIWIPYMLVSKRVKATFVR